MGYFGPIGVGSIAYAEYARRLFPAPGKSDREINDLTAAISPGMILVFVFHREQMDVLMFPSCLLVGSIFDHRPRPVRPRAQRFIQAVQGTVYLRPPGGSRPPVGERATPEQQYNRTRATLNNREQPLFPLTGRGSANATILPRRYRGNTKTE